MAADEKAVDRANSWNYKIGSVWEENLGATKIELTAGDVRELEEASSEVKIEAGAVSGVSDASLVGR